MAMEQGFGKRPRAWSALKIFADVAVAELARLQQEKEEEEDGRIRLLKGKMKMVEEKKDQCICLVNEKEEKKKKRMMLCKGESSRSRYHRPYKKMMTVEMERNPSPIGWVEAHSRMPNSTPPIFAFEKNLYESDTTKHHNRLVIPKGDAYGKLLPALGYKQEDEQTVLKEGIQVLGLDQMGRRWELTWKWWPIGNVQVLTRNWSKLLSANGLEPKKDYVKGFVFRYGENQENICFVITSFRKEEEEEEVENAIAAVPKKKRSCSSIYRR